MAASLGVKKRELLRPAVAVIIFEPHHHGLSFAAILQDRHPVVESLINEIRDIEAIVAAAVFHDDVERIDDAARPCVNQRDARRPTVVAAPGIFRARVNLSGLSRVTLRPNHPQEQCAVGVRRGLQGPRLDDETTGREVARSSSFWAAASCPGRAR
jgi:hypothetical protein